MTPLLTAAVLATATILPHPSPDPDGPNAPEYRTEDVRYESGGLTLAALLMIPVEADSTAPVMPRPAVVVLQGSGTSDRSNPWARAIAEELVDAGLVVLLTDKRGSGASGGDWRTADFHDLADDALAGVRFLGDRPEAAADRIGLVGLSQGGWVAPIAASRSDDVAFVVNVSGATVSFAEQSFHEMANTARSAGVSEAQVDAVLSLNRAAGSYLVTGAWGPYERARNEGLEADWGELAEGFPGERDAPIWTFLRGVMDYAPMPYWLLVDSPVLVLYGEEDEHDNVPVAESVRRLEHGFASVGKKNAKIVVVPDAGHAFIDPERRELMPAFVEALTGWVRATAGSGPVRSEG